MASTNSISSARPTNTLVVKLAASVRSTKTLAVKLAALTISFFKSELFLSILACYIALFVCVGTIIVAGLSTGELSVVW